MGKNKKDKMLKFKILTESLFYKTGLIKFEEIDEYTYGLEVVFLKFVHILLFLLVGIYENCLFRVLLFLIVLSFIRGKIGGYHASTRIKCFLISVAMLSILCLSAKYINNRDSLLLLNLFVAISLIKVNYQLIYFLLLLQTFVFLVPYEISCSVFLAELFSLLLYVVKRINYRKKISNG